MIIRLLKFIIFSFVLLISTKAASQRDLIITKAGEEIRCKILDETAFRFKYAYLSPKNKVLRNEIFKTLVSSFKYNHYNDDLLKNDKLNQPKKQSAESRIDTRKSSSSNFKNSNGLEEVKKNEPSIKETKLKNPSTKEITNSEKKDVEKEVDNKVVAPEIKAEDKTKSSVKIEDKKTEKVKDGIAKNKIPKIKDKKALPIAIPDVKDTTKVLKMEIVKVEDKKALPIPASEVKDTTNVHKMEIVKVEDKKANEPVKEIAIDDIKKADNRKKDQEQKIQSKSAEKSPFTEPEPISEFRNYMKYRIGVKGGLGNIIQKSTDTSPYGLYKEKLLRGWMFGADAAYFFNDNIGLGAVYTNYQSSNSSKNLDYPNFITQEAIKAGELSNKVSHKFVGPTLLYRKSIDFKTFAVLTLSPGMHLYTDKGLANLSNYKYTGKAYGASATLGIDFLLGNDIYGRDIILSLEGGYNYGQITSLNYGGVTGTQTLSMPINLNRLDFSIGLRFTRFPVYLR